MTIVLLGMSGDVISDLVVWFHRWWPWPSSGLFSADSNMDKVVHTSLFAVCGALFYRGWKSLQQRWLFLALSLVILGAVTELFQTLIPARSADITDLIANSVGVIAGIAIAGIYLHWRRSR